MRTRSMADADKRAQKQIQNVATSIGCCISLLADRTRRLAELLHNSSILCGCGNAVDVQNSIYSFVVICPTCGRQTCLSCRAAANLFTDDYLLADLTHGATCNRSRPVSPGFEAAWSLALEIVRAEVQWMAEAYSTVRSTRLLPPEMWLLVLQYVVPPNSWAGARLL